MGIPFPLATAYLQWSCSIALRRLQCLRSNGLQSWGANTEQKVSTKLLCCGEMNYLAIPLQNRWRRSPMQILYLIDR